VRVADPYIYAPALAGRLSASAAASTVSGSFTVLFSGCWRYVHVEGEGLGVGVVVAGVAFQGERDSGHAVALRVLAGGGAATIDVQGGTR